MNIRLLEKTDIAVIVNGFKESGWQIKPASIFEQYLDEQRQDKRICLVTFVDEEFAGYITLKWQSDYKSFAKDKIPEISDLNVLPSFRNKGVGSALIEKCEEYAAERSNIVGISVGLYPDYGSAQRLYINRGYLPDGHGATYNYEYVIPGKEYPLDDDLVLWFTKKLDNIPSLNKSNESIIFQTRNWIVSHRKDSRYLGYLIISSVSSSDELHKLSSQALQEVGIAIANTEKLLKLAYAPYKIIFSKLGFSAGYNCHFHVIPVFDHILHEIIEHSNYTSESPDGKDVMLFISREYCEKPLSEQEKSDIKLTEKKLKKLFDTNFNINKEFQ